MKKRKASLTAAALFSLALLAGCANTPPTTALPVQGFDHLPPAMLNAASVEIVQTYTPPMERPHVEHLFPTPLYKTIERYGRERFQMGSDTGKVRVIIDEASVLEETLPKHTGIQDFFYRDQDKDYKGRIALQFKFYADDAAMIPLGEARVVSERTMSMEEGIAPAERDRQWLEMSEQMVNDLDAAVLRVLRSELPQMLIETPPPAPTGAVPSPAPEIR